MSDLYTPCRFRVREDMGGGWCVEYAVVGAMNNWILSCYKTSRDEAMQVARDMKARVERGLTTEEL